MSRLRPIVLLLSFGLAAGANHWFRPRILYEMPAGERALATGSLALLEGAERIEWKLVTVHPVEVTIRRVLAEPIAVSELWLRSPEQDARSQPDLELFVDFAGGSGQAAGGSGPSVLLQRELPVLARAIGGDARSRVRLPGASTAAQVSEGKLVIDELLGTESQANYRIAGKLSLVVREDDRERVLNGTFNARLFWD